MQVSETGKAHRLAMALYRFLCSTDMPGIPHSTPDTLHPCFMCPHLMQADRAGWWLVAGGWWLVAGGWWLAHEAYVC